MPIISGGGGGGNTTAQVVASGKVIPNANANGATVDSTTYADTLKGGGAKLTTLVYPGTQGAIAFAITGDAFPRAVLCGDPFNEALFFIGDGSFDATLGGASVAWNNGDLFLSPTTGVGNYVHCTGAVFLAVAAPGASHAPRLGQVSPKFTITSGALPTVTLSSGTGAQVSTARDVETVTPFTGDATNNAATCKVELSADNVTYSTLNTMSIAAALNVSGALDLNVNVRVPAGWYLKLTATHGALGTTTYY